MRRRAAGCERVGLFHVRPPRVDLRECQMPEIPVLLLTHARRDGRMSVTAPGVRGLGTTASFPGDCLPADPGVVKGDTINQLNRPARAHIWWGWTAVPLDLPSTSLQLVERWTSISMDALARAL